MNRQNGRLLLIVFLLSCCHAFNGYGQKLIQTQNAQSQPDDTVIVDIATLQGTPGDTICVPFRVQNFDSMLGMQFTLRWNPIMFEYTHYQNFNLPEDDSLPLNTNYIQQGYLLLSWVGTDFDQGHTIPDSNTMMEVCFKTKGSPGDTSECNITGQPLVIEFTQYPLGAFRTIIPHKILPGTVEIVPPDTLYGEYNSCPTPAGTETGSFDVSVYSGTPPYHIQWEHSENPNLYGSDTIAQEGGSVFYSDLPPTSDSTYYDLSITDQADSTTKLRVEIEEAPSIYADIGVKNNCPDPGHATLGLDSVRALKPYTLEWSTGRYNVPKIRDLSAGNYTLTLTDRNGCQITDSFDLIFRKLRMDYKTVKDNTCKGTADGSISIKARKGNPDEQGRYTYQWNDQTREVDTASTRSGLPAGDYWVRIIDENNCKIFRNITVHNKQAVSIEEQGIDSVSCYGGTDGNIAFSIFMEGGPEPEDSTYSFAWSSDIQTMSSEDSAWTGPSLAAGTYDVTVYDDSTQAGCRNDFSFTVEEPDSLYHTVQLTPVTDSTPIGSIALDIFGGTPPYSIEWFNQGNQINPQLDSMEAGTYMFRLTDDNGCMLIDTIIVEDLTTAANNPKSDSQWKLYPNPANLRLHLECNRCTDRILRWKLIDVQETIHRGEAYDHGISPQLDIPVESLGPGVYLLRWTTEEGRTWSKKAVIY